VVVASCPKVYSPRAFRACIDSATRVYVEAWTRDLHALGIAKVTAPRIVIFSAPPKNPCLDLSQGDAAEASFWCGKNGTIYVSETAAPFWTQNYAQAAVDAHVLESDAATARTTQRDLRSGYPLVGATTEFAHELGHWAQQVSGQMAWYETRLASSDFATSNGATVASELAADCMAGWVQGRVTAEGSWVDTAVGRWAHHATMAELGGDLSEVKAGFSFPAEKPASIVAYGNANTRLHFYDLGFAAGRAAKPGLATCSRAAATYNGTAFPPYA
jgi:hypothetical protein